MSIRGSQDRFFSSRRGRRGCRWCRFARGATTLIWFGVLASTLAGCATPLGAVPSCNTSQRLALVAQSVPQASYLPCLHPLPQGWRTTSFDASDRRTRFSLLSDRAAGRAVNVELVPACDINGATPTTPHSEGVRTYTRLRSIDPRYTGTLYDVFPGGCVTYTFDFLRGPHIALIEDFEGAVGLFSRRQLRIELHKQLGVSLEP